MEPTLYKIIISIFILSKTLADPVLTKDTAAGSKVDNDDDLEDVYDEVSSPDSEDVYASEFPYGEPLEKFKFEKQVDRASARSGRAHVRIVHKWVKPKNYAKKYQTWMPAKEWIKEVGPKGVKRLGGVSEPPRRGKPGHRRNGPQRRRKVKPSRANHLRKPLPPPEPDYDYISEEEYFPEETKRNEYQYNERRPQTGKMKRRKPPKFNKDQRHIPKDDFGSVSYSNFVQHPSSSSPPTIDYTDFFEDEEPPRSRGRRRKKKKRKGDRKKIRDQDDDQYGAHSESSEENHIKGFSSERYPPFYDNTRYRRPLRHPTPTPATPVYGEGYIGNQVASTKFPQGQGLINRGFDDGPGLSRYRNDMHSGTPQTFGNQYYEATGLNHFGISNNRPQQEIFAQQNYQQFQNPGLSQTPQPQFNEIQVSPPNFNAINNLNQQAVNNFNRPVNTYNKHLVNRPTVSPQNQNAHNYQNVPTFHHEFSSKYKSNSFFDNTETFHDFNQNLNLQEEKKFGLKQGRPNDFVPSREYQEPGEAENEFINRHLDLYSNGMSGVPIQGDGFGKDRRQEVRPKDYDIGYGELQYDETHAHAQ